MPVDSYFKVSGHDLTHVEAFHTADRYGTMEAWRKAIAVKAAFDKERPPVGPGKLAAPARISFWKKPRIDGPWSKYASFVGEESAAPRVPTTETMAMQKRIGLEGPALTEGLRRLNDKFGKDAFGPS